MFFFIGGIQPKSVTLDEQPRVCPSCGLPQARYRRIDHYVSLFFIPLFPIKKGDPFLDCPTCGPNRPGGPSFPDVGQRWPGRCPGCGASVEDRFRYCPHCGKPLR